MSVPQDSVEARALAFLKGVHVVHPSPTWTMSLQGRVVNANPALLAFLGVTMEQLDGGDLTSALHPDDRKWPGFPGPDGSRELRLRRHDGHYRWLQVASQALTDQEAHLGWLVSAVDVHDYRSRSQEETEEQALLQSVIDGSSDCIKILDLEAQLLSMNVGGMQVMEVEDLNACRLAFWPSFWEGETRREVEEAIQAARDGHTRVFEGAARTFKGTPRFWEVTVSPIRNQEGAVHRLLAISRDITPRRRQEQLIKEQSRLLEQVATGTPLPDVLHGLARLIEQQSDGLFCAVLGYDARHQHLFTLAAPSLPPEYTQAIDGVQPGPEAGCCGTAVFLRKPVMVADLATDSRWGNDRDLAAAHNLRACWSVPVISAGGEVQGTLVVYAQETRLPTPDEEQLLSAATHLAQIAFERDRLLHAERQARRERDESAALLDAFFNAAPVGFGFFDTQLRFQKLNAALAEMNGESLEAHLGKTVTDLLPGIPDTMRPLQQVLETGDVVSDVLITGETRAAPGMLRSWSERVFPVRDIAGQVLGVGAIATDITEQRKAEERLRAQAERLSTLNRVNQLVSAELDLDKLVQAVTDAGVELTGAQFGAFFYNLVNERQETYTLYALSGVPREAFAAFPMPRSTKIFGPTFAGEGVLRVADITQDARYGQNPPYRGMPPGHLPVRSYLAVPVTSRSGEVLGGLFFGHAEPGVFSEGAEQLAVGLAAQTAVALDNARLYGQLQDSHAQLERRVRERTEELEAHAMSLDAFAAFTEAVGTETDVEVLAQQAIAVLRTRFPNDTIGYHEPDAGVWKLRVWTPDIAPEILATLQRGLPEDTPTLAQTLHTRTAVFVNAWDADRERIERTEVYGAVGAYPLVVDGMVRGVLSIGRSGTPEWTERDKALFSAVGRGFTLAQERAAQTNHIEAQRDALDVRSRALEAFALLTRDLNVDVDPLALVRRAQEILMPLLPEGYALYWQPDGARWVNRSQLGSLGHPALQEVIDAGLPRGQAATLDRAWLRQQAVFEDTYSVGADTDPEVASHVRAAAMLPVMVKGQPHGMLGVGLFVQRHWTSMDKAVLETVARSLGLALEAAESAQALKERTQELERSNAELEKFAYVASHDLQEPLRTIASFSELIERRYGEGLDDRGRQYLHLVSNGAQRMKVLIDDLLVFSRLNAVREPHSVIPLAEPFQEAVGRLHAALEHSGAVVRHDPLPTVTGSASELTQLFQNLLGNAIKFCREGIAPEIRIGARREGDCWHVTVRDNGIGFEPQYAERVFQIFQRLHVREKYEGTGMGLAIVRKIIEHHGGRIWVESEPGSGSTFHFTLPAVEEA